MTLPDIGPERPGDASETREMAEQDRMEVLGDGPRGRVVLVASILIVIAVVVWLLVR